MPSLTIYVDVDDTFVRSYGSTRIPIPGVVDHIRELSKAGVELYCWSSGGAVYARESAEEFGIDGCFSGFLPKPTVIIDDQALGDWRRLIVVHPSECQSLSREAYEGKLAEALAPGRTGRDLRR